MLLYLKEINHSFFLAGVLTVLVGFFMVLRASAPEASFPPGPFSLDFPAVISLVLISQ